MSDPLTNRAWIDVDRAALRKNFEVLRRSAGPHAGVLAMVKADAYGVGAREVVATLEPLGPRAYGVAAVAEGIALREWGVTRDIIVFTPMPPADVERAAAHGLVATISHIDALRRWADAGRRHEGLRFHVEIDTGMGRAGLPWREWEQWAPAIRSAAGNTAWSGVYTHFHSADAPDPAAAAAQWERFQATLARLGVRREGFLVHTSNSAAIVRWPAYAADMVRAGIYLYGGDPAEVPGEYEPPAPVVSVRARVVLVRDVPAGTTCGYGATHTAAGAARWATLAIGYGDGLPRALGNRGHALVRGCRVPIIGRISMDLTVVDITGLEGVAPGEVATLLGSDGDEAITVEELAAHADTISYEILTGFTPRLPRVGRENE